MTTWPTILFSTLQFDNLFDKHTYAHTRVPSLTVGKAPQIHTTSNMPNTHSSKPADGDVILPCPRGVLTGEYREQLRADRRASSILEASMRAHSLRVHKWTPRPSPLGYGSKALEAFCNEFARLATLIEEGWH